MVILLSSFPVESHHSDLELNGERRGEWILRIYIFPEAELSALLVCRIFKSAYTSNSTYIFLLQILLGTYLDPCLPMFLFIHIYLEGYLLEY